MMFVQQGNAQWRYVALTALVWLAIVLALSLSRSAWVDEMFTAFATDPRTPTPALVEIWRRETHPPFHYAMIWAIRQVIDLEGIFALRLPGVALSAAFAAGAIAYWRSVGWPGIGLFATLLFTSPIVLFFAGETRSYFLAMFGGLFGGLYLLRAFEAHTPDKPTARDAAVGVAAALLLATHLISLAFEYILFGLAMLLMIWEQRWAWLRLTLTVGATVTLPITVLCLMTIFGGVADALSSFWITRRQLLDTVIGLPFLLGLPLVAAIGWALLRRHTFTNRREQVAGAVILAIAASVFLIGIISLIKPMLVPRYLAGPVLALVPPSAILLAYLCPKLDAVRAVLALAVCFAVNFAAVRYRLDYRSDWRGPAQALNATPSCDGAVVPYLIFNHAPDPRNIWRRYFEWYAPGNVYLPAAPEALAQSSQQACPVRLWIANQVAYHVAEDYRRIVRDVCAAGDRAALDFGDAYLIVDSNSSIAPERARQPCDSAQP